MKRRTVALVFIGLLTAGAGGLLATSRIDDQVDLGSVVEIWGDIMRDVDHLGLTITRISAEREMEIGRGIENVMATMRAPRLQAYVTRIGEALIKHSQRKGISYRFHIMRSAVVNAYAIPGGGVYVTTGMLRFLESEAELAALLGHEISHVDLKHCIERLQYELAASRIIGDDLAAIVSVGYGLVGLGFSEQQELEADVTGMILAANAGYDPHAAISLHERLGKLKGESPEREKTPTLMVEEVGTALGIALQQYFATHPPAELRVRQLEQAAKRNARAWKRQKFHVGRTEYGNQIERLFDERPMEPGRLIRDCPDCPEMVVIPEGSFMMGSPSYEEGRDNNEGPQHRVIIRKPFAVGKYEIMFREWDACVADGGCNGYRARDLGWGRGNRPVIIVSWDDAQAYLRWLSRESGAVYRLLSEAEWEYAARAGTTTPFHFGSTISPDQANYAGFYTYGSGRKGVYRKKTVPVGNFPSNAFGLHDVHGNVWEWVEDCWNSSYSGAPNDGSAWMRGECEKRVLRGGSWNYRPGNVRSAKRSGLGTGNQHFNVGFRVARTLP